VSSKLTLTFPPGIVGIKGREGTGRRRKGATSASADARWQTGSIGLVCPRGLDTSAQIRDFNARKRGECLELFNGFRLYRVAPKSGGCWRKTVPKPSWRILSREKPRRATAGLFRPGRGGWESENVFSAGTKLWERPLRPATSAFGKVGPVGAQALTRRHEDPRFPTPVGCRGRKWRRNDSPCLRSAPRKGTLWEQWSPKKVSNAGGEEKALKGSSHGRSRHEIRSRSVRALRVTPHVQLNPSRGRETLWTAPTKAWRASSVGFRGNTGASEKGAPDVDVLGGKNLRRGGSQCSGATLSYWAEGKVHALWRRAELQERTFASSPFAELTSRRIPRSWSNSMEGVPEPKTALFGMGNTLKGTVTSREAGRCSGNR